MSDSDVMKYENWFDTEENKALLAICARKLIKNIGIGAIIWGIINTLLGIVAIQVTTINAGLLLLGVIMLGTGVRALKKPTLHVLLIATIVSFLLFTWNLSISFLNFYLTGTFEPTGLVFPVIIAIIFLRQYRKLQHIKEHISMVQPKEIKDAKNICKTLVKAKLKDEPAIIQARNQKCRAQLMADKAFFIQRNMKRAFIVPKDRVQSLFANPEAKSLKLSFNHPLGQLRYTFDKNNSEKIRAWLASPAA